MADYLQTHLQSHGADGGHPRRRGEVGVRVLVGGERRLELEVHLVDRAVGLAVPGTGGACVYSSVSIPHLDAPSI